MNSKIKTNFEFPRGDDLQKQGQRLAQDLSLSMKGIVNELNTVSTNLASVKSFVDIVFTFSGGGSAQTKAHGLGVIPTGWYVIDSTTSSTTTIVYPVRQSWDDTNITIYFSSSPTVTLKIRVFS